MGVAVLCTSLSGLQGQELGSGLEQQLRSQYAVTRVGANGVLVHAGTVLKVLKDGIRSMPASYAVFWPNNYKGSRIGYHWSCPKCKFNLMRPLQVGEMVYLTDLEIKEADLVFRIQSCGTCGTSQSDQNDTPYTAEMSFELGKGYLTNSTLKEVQDTIGQVFETVPQTQPPSPVAPPPPPAPVAPLRLPATYVNAQGETDQLSLNSDYSFSLQEGGQSYHGTFVDKGSTLELSISETGDKTTVTKQGSNLADSSGQNWVLREQPAPRAAAAEILKNEDIINLTKVGLDDATILAKIASSKCQFDTSTGALIQLKQSGVSAAVMKAVIKAMNGAGK
jgi:hypothetical protein